MSVKDFVGNTGGGEETLESLMQVTKQLSAQVDKAVQIMKKPAESFTLQDFTSLRSQIKKLKSKADKTLESFNKIADASNPQEAEKISEKISDCQNRITQLNEFIASMSAREQELIEKDEKRKIEEEKQKTMEQLEAEHMSTEAEALNVAAKEIVTGMKAVAQVQGELAENIAEQHEQIIGIDKTMEEAHEIMKAGNEDLEKAQEHQKMSKKVAIFYGVVGIFILILLALLIWRIIVVSNK